MHASRFGWLQQNIPRALPNRESATAAPPFRVGRQTPPHGLRASITGLLRATDWSPAVPGLSRRTLYNSRPPALRTVLGIQIAGRWWTITRPASTRSSAPVTARSEAPHGTCVVLGEVRPTWLRRQGAISLTSRGRPAHCWRFRPGDGPLAEGGAGGPAGSGWWRLNETPAILISFLHMTETPWPRPGGARPSGARGAGRQPLPEEIARDIQQLGCAWRRLTQGIHIL